MTMTLELGRAVARWAGIFAILGDEERFKHVAESIGVIDEMRAVIEHIQHLQNLLSEDATAHRTAIDQSLSAVVVHWSSLTAALADEDRYWEQQLHAESKTPMPRRSDWDERASTL